MEIGAVESKMGVVGRKWGWLVENRGGWWKTGVAGVMVNW